MIMDYQEVLDKYVDPAALKSTLINGFGIGNYETQVRGLVDDEVYYL
jgi:hypothetical protein